eukprot:gene4917-5058_t
MVTSIAYTPLRIGSRQASRACVVVERPQQVTKAREWMSTWGSPGNKIHPALLPAERPSPASAGGGVYFAPTAGETTTPGEADENLRGAARAADASWPPPVPVTGTGQQAAPPSAPRTTAGKASPAPADSESSEQAFAPLSRLLPGGQAGGYSGVSNGFMHSNSKHGAEIHAMQSALALAQ